MALTAFVVAPTFLLQLSNSMADSSRAILRSQLRRVRQNIPAADRAPADLAINQRLVSSVFFRNARTLALYAAFDGEPDVGPTIDAALQLRKRVYLPVLPDAVDQPLQFAQLKSRRHTQSNDYGIAEPAVSPGGLIAPSDLDLVIMPLVGFDPFGNRLGMGAGYYDRTFAFVAKCRQSKVPRLLGVAYEVQKLTRLQTETWDVPLRHIATETDFYNPDHDSREN